MTDANEITHALRLWFQVGDVFEVRVLDAEEKATAQVRALIVGFISTMHTLMTEQYFADKYHGERNDRRK